MTPQAAKRLLFRVQPYPVLSHFLGKALEDSETSDIDTTAASFDMTRAELLSFTLNWLKKYRWKNPSLSFNRAMQAHAALQRVVKELARIGLKSDYTLNLIDNYPNYGEPRGTFSLNVWGKKVLSSYKEGLLPNVPSPLYVYDTAGFLGPIGELVITVENPTEVEDDYIRSLYASVNEWAADLRKLEPDGFRSVRSLLG